MESARFGREVDELAEREDLTLTSASGWRYATVSLSTKKIKGLHRNDFIKASGSSIARDRSLNFKQ
ncbi:4a-hydroxytetrahydrobiopterin dehydratase [Bradyrhizobium sp. AZCC 2289]|uniref:4a-hydroxytetrahydrobiopterin dehydratase n=1 Tax=Bradyrhizobium sp. AZCC 2289 TaxID=3117026 RepID=UPI002FF26FC1